MKDRGPEHYDYVRFLLKDIEENGDKEPLYFRLGAMDYLVYKHNILGFEGELYSTNREEFMSGNLKKIKVKKRPYGSEVRIKFNVGKNQRLIIRCSENYKIVLEKAAAEGKRRHRELIEKYCGGN